jgi:hypothetical protein
LLLLLAAATVGVPDARAGSEIYQQGTATCTTTNCSALGLNATIKSFGASAGKWVAEVFAKRSECFRIDITQRLPPDSGSDLELVVVAPNGIVYRNDNKGSGACPTCPLVRIRPTPNEGWYTVSVGTSNGQAVDENFRILFGRYPSGNPNCGATTPPLGASVAGDDGGVPDLQPSDLGGPGQ